MHAQLVRYDSDGEHGAVEAHGRADKSLVSVFLSKNTQSAVNEFQLQDVSLFQLHPVSVQLTKIFGSRRPAIKFH